MSETAEELWEMPLDELAKRVKTDTGMEWGSPKHAEREMIGLLLNARATLASGRRQFWTLVATWVLACSTIILAFATIALATQA